MSFNFFILDTIYFALTHLLNCHFFHGNSLSWSVTKQYLNSLLKMVISKISRFSLFSEDIIAFYLNNTFSNTVTKHIIHFMGLPGHLLALQTGIVT